MSAIELLDEEGENLAVRSFLMQYSCDRALTIGAMRKHMDMSGWPLQYCPEFARIGDYDSQYLTKAGAQLWIRHLFELEARPAAVAPVLTDEQLDVMVSQPKTWIAADGQDAQGWISIKDREPEEGEAVLVSILTDYTNAPSSYSVLMASTRFGQWFGNGGAIYAPTHWMPLPAAPDAAIADKEKA